MKDVDRAEIKTLLALALAQVQFPASIKCKGSYCPSRLAVPGVVARSDARALGFQTVTVLILQSSKAFFR